MLFFEYFKIGCMYLYKFFLSESMKWGYVGYHFLYCYINYCILCKEKADEKPGKKKTELNCGNTNGDASVKKPGRVSGDAPSGRLNWKDVKLT